MSNICPNCNGSGVDGADYIGFYSTPLYHDHRCDTCAGTGKVGTDNE